MENPHNPLRLTLAYVRPDEVSDGTVVTGGKNPAVRSYGPDHLAAFPAAYDPKTGLLAISGKAYRPAPAYLLKRRAKH